MRFSLKIFFSVLTITAISLGFGGAYLITALFNSALEREIDQALDENNIMRFAFETASISLPSKYDRLQDITIEQIGQVMEIEDSSMGRYVRILSEGGNSLYTSPVFDHDIEITQPAENIKTYRVVKSGECFFIQTGAVVKALDRHLTLETFKDVTSIFAERDNNFALFRNISLIILALEAIMVYILAIWLTKPIYRLRQAAKIMAGGDYSHRADKISDDELGMLTDDFNKMASSLEIHMRKLQHEAVAKEDFVAAMAHEIKTPLTSIIGYSDMLRSYKMDEEQLFQSANYIFNEGKRLESLSLKLLDLIVLSRHEIELSYVNVSEITGYLEKIYKGREGFVFDINCQDALILAEIYLLKTVLVNLVDNAVKSLKEQGEICVRGFIDEEIIDMPGFRNYRFVVEDNGIGIPEEELSRITEVFYMVDKSRTRSGGKGAGIGLALSAEILKLHNSKIEFTSEVGQGTSVSFTVKCLFNNINEEA